MGSPTRVGLTDPRAWTVIGGAMTYRAHAGQVARIMVTPIASARLASAVVNARAGVTNVRTASTTTVSAMVIDGSTRLLRPVRIHSGIAITRVITVNQMLTKTPVQKYRPNMASEARYASSSEKGRPSQIAAYHRR